MFLAIVKILPLARARTGLLEILESVSGPTRAKEGCLGSSVLEEHGGEGDGLVWYVEQWRGEEEMDVHLRSPLYRRVLEAMELSRVPPEVVFHRISASGGFERVDRLRRPSGP
jgi:quinol monooxygenase YgiN